jgi:hypothetical protein
MLLLEFTYRCFGLLGLQSYLNIVKPRILLITKFSILNNTFLAQLILTQPNHKYFTGIIISSSFKVGLKNYLYLISVPINPVVLKLR